MNTPIDDVRFGLAGPSNARPMHYGRTAIAIADDWAYSAHNHDPLPVVVAQGRARG